MTYPQQIENPKNMVFARPFYYGEYHYSNRISMDPLKSNMNRKMIIKATLGLCLLLFMGTVGQSSAQSSEGTQYDLDYMSVTVPRNFDITYEEGEDGKRFLIYGDNAFFGLIGYIGQATNPLKHNQAINYLQQANHYFKEIKSGCNDGLVALNINYCSVAYYAEDSRGNDGQYYFQTSTQIGRDVSVLWTTSAYDLDRLVDKTATLLNIVNSMYIHNFNR